MRTSLCLISLLPQSKHLFRSLTLPALPSHAPRYHRFTTSLPARTSPELHSQPSPPQANPHRAYYQTYGRALFKCLTLAFFSYQVVYWGWLTLETEEIKEGKKREIKGLEGEIKELQDGKGIRKDGRKRVLEEGGQNM